jgi:hypothetical protein
MTQTTPTNADWLRFYMARSQRADDLATRLALLEAKLRGEETQP